MEKSLENKLRLMLRENFVSEADNEDKPDGTGEGEGESAKAQAMYSRIQQVLKNDLINHAAIVRRLWGDDTANGRSLFRKKLHREETESGKANHHFDNSELIEINRILMTLGSDVIGGLGGGKRKQKRAGKEASNDAK